MTGNVAWTIAGTMLAAILVLWLWGERWRPLRRSTWQMVRVSGWRRFLKLTTLHGYVYARWTDLYVNIGSRYIAPHLGLRGKTWLANHYHGKVLPTDLAQAVITVEHDIPLSDLEQIIPYPLARDLVLQGPPDIAVYDCPCRKLSAHPCQPIQVCTVVGQPFVDFILEHHPTSARQLAQDEAVALLRAEHERGHIHTAWFKDASAGRFYAICNCCRCCCGGIKAMTELGIPMIASSGYVALLDEDTCSSCGACVDACPFGALSLNDAHVLMDWEKCMGCGVCEGQCPHEAISLVRDERKGLPMDVRLLAKMGGC